jgi:hypothetical protein
MARARARMMRIWRIMKQDEGDEKEEGRKVMNYE